MDYFVRGGKYVAWDMAYYGAILPIVMAFLAGGYMFDRTVNAAYGSGGFKFYYNYAGASTAGNFLGLYEVLNVIPFLTLGIVLIYVGGFYSAYEMWARYEDIQAKNIALSKVDGFKYLCLGFVKGFSTWVVALALGSASETLVGFFDGYNTATEAVHCNDDGTNCQRDAVGTSLIVDLVIHELEAWGIVIAAASIVALAWEQFNYWFDLMKP